MDRESGKNPDNFFVETPNAISFEEIEVEAEKSRGRRAKKGTLPDEGHPSLILEDSKARFVLFSGMNMTKLETRLWKILGKELNPWAFVPQVPLYGYLADFYSKTYEVILEADGPRHMDAKGKDSQRDAIFRNHGIRTLRITELMLNTNTPQSIFRLIEDFLLSPKPKKVAHA